MYAIIEDSGHQFKVEEGQELQIDYRDLSAGQEIRFERVLAYRDEQGLQIGHPYLSSVCVRAEVLGPVIGPKIVIRKFKRRKNYRRKIGHRQLYTRIRIAKIELKPPSA
ncbi:MAG: 50S ribosomal protein L21 [Thermoguttaceae bacterium]|nr:50S ribosomal protein L21 [Thermoguttaceae bacterium]MDW8037848.1 50S ribosomal protein L21 [Thermoguttaceae bacterium]